MPCYTTKTERGSTMFLCGRDLDLPTCADCKDVADLLCDYPVGDGKTCDRSVCTEHGIAVGDDIHYCRSHHDRWMKWARENDVVTAPHWQTPSIDRDDREGE